MQFMILANPRSRTRWLSEYFRCGHDQALGCRSVDEFAAKLQSSVGSVETSVALGWKLWKKLFPQARFVVIHRAPAEVAESFSRFGLAPDWMFLYQQDRALFRFVRSKRAALYSFDSLTVESVRDELCAWVGVPFDPDWDAKLAGERIEVDPAERLALVEANRGNFAAFNDDMARRLIALEYGTKS